MVLTKITKVLLAVAVLATSALAQDAVTDTAVPATDAALPLTADAINAADLMSLPAQYTPPVGNTEGAAPLLPDPAIAKLQVLLDRAGASPGVIDGYDGDNVRKAVIAFQLLNGLEPTGIIDPDLVARLGDEPVTGVYTILPEDSDDVTGPIPTDYAEMAQLDFLGYATLAEKLAERFHMDIKLLEALNPDATYEAGSQLMVAAPGANREGTVARIAADKALRQVRAYDAGGVLLAAYPATIGSEDNPSPSGVHVVEGVAPMPDYTYNPQVNFQQGDNTEVLILPPGPNGPVGSMWIDLSEPTYGIHGTPEPNLIDKTGSHGCVRLTNWDAEELAGMVEPGVAVEFLG